MKAPEVKDFRTAAEFRRWLARNRERAEGIWLRFAKKGSGIASMTYAEALDEALCHGWIDGQMRPMDERFWIRKFTPRRAGGGWSKRNTDHAERLMAAGRMTSAGMKQVEAAKTDGRWHAAYDSPRNATAPEDFLSALAKDKKAKRFFGTLNKANVYAITYRLQTAKKPETRARRMKLILEMLSREEKFH